MQGNLSFPTPNLSIAELFGSAFQKGGLTSSDRFELMSAFLNNALTIEDRLAIDRLLYAVRRGRIKMLD